MHQGRRLIHILGVFLLVYSPHLLHAQLDDYPVAPPPPPPRPCVVATIFPHYDWLRNIMGDRTNEVDLVLLQQNGADLHNYSPTASDLRILSRCTLFVYIGGSSDSWVTKALAATPNPHRETLDLIHALEPHVRTHAHSHDAPHTAQCPDHDDAPDEHIWLSLRFATSLCNSLCNALSRMDREGTPQYRANTSRYIDELNALNREYDAFLRSPPQKTLIVADRFPFTYLAEDYSLPYYAAFPGCSAESHASFKTITSLAQRIDALQLHAIYTLEQPSHRLADAILKTAKTRPLRILKLDSMQSIQAPSIHNGTSYLSIMRANLDALKEGLQ